MKKYILALAVISNCTLLMAQTEFDASKFIQSDINGTARYVGMAGAFGALGGDASAIKDNPAGLGVYRTSEISGTFNIGLQNSNAVWNGTTAKDNRTNTTFSNFSYIKASPTFRSMNGESGLLSSNWAFSYNRLKSFNRNSTVKSSSSASSITDYMAYFTGNIPSADLIYVPNSYEPFDNTNSPWISVLAYEGALIGENVNAGKSSWTSILGSNELVAPTYTLQETGYMDEYSVGWSGNYSNTFYFGATLNLQSIDYTARSRYSETFGAGGGMTLNNTVYTSGTGFNLKLGAIIRPTDMLRLGLSIHTPSIYNMTDNNYSSIDYDTSIKGNLSTPTSDPGYSNYKLNNPWKFNVSGAVVIGQKGLISAEYNYNLNTTAKLYDQDGNAQSFSDENTGIKDMLKDVQTIKIGGEYKMTDNISLRAGFAHSSAATNNSQADKLMRYNTTRTDTEYFQNNKTDYLTAGFGYREATWFIDFAYMNKILDETFYPYNSNSLAIAVKPASVKTTNNNIVVTLGFKF